VEAVQTRPSEALKKWLSTRRGTWTLAAVSAGLAGLILFVYLNQYKDDVNASVAPAPVLVADRFIPKGTSGTEVATEKLFRPAAVPEQDRRVGAVADAASIAGKVATRPILPGQQISASDFTVAGDAIRSRIQGTERAVQIPMDKIRGLGGVLTVGDRIDILATFNTTNKGNGVGTPSLQPLMRNVRVMQVPLGGRVILQLTDRDAAKLAYAADNAQLWFLLRPPVGAKDSKPLSVTRETLALGKPIDVSEEIQKSGRTP
jgi:Flp pilus assembly protein CpaB